MYGFSIWTIISLAVIAPFAIATVIFAAVMLFKVARNIYIHIRYGLEHTDQDG